jgi:hypothetical protein
MFTHLDIRKLMSLKLEVQFQWSQLLQLENMFTDTSYQIASKQNALQCLYHSYKLYQMHPNFLEISNHM